ncbi:CU044_5270 family protein [Actinomadura alba]|uniref:CU044_5270 family protein n=1 Tax=Actinomadura alba TaxID=406431 RepID=A0ABR7LXT6_9ACTN|nr:CU044_5270 family protein [Actinomadura alba]MBC6469669.1 CU044_5270 family protein [Actinomadura alba]
MNDQTPPPRQDMPAGHHAARRTHLMSEMTTRHRRRSGRRVLIGGLTTAALAGGVAAALVIAPTAEVDHEPTVALAGAPQILDRAAATAAGQPDIKPRPDQFVYVEAKSRQAPLRVVAGQPVQPGQVTHRRVWLSVNGERAGLLHNDGEDPTWLCDTAPNAKGREPKKLPEVDLTRPPRECHAFPAYRPGLPTDPRTMRSWLYRESRGGNPPDVQAFITVGDTLRESYVAPAAKAAMFKAAATIPGVTVTGDTVDLAGRKGIAVGQTWNRIRHELIFEAKTYRLLGERQVVDHDDTFKPSGGKSAPPKSGRAPDAIGSAKEGTVLYTRATLTLTITDKVGQRPTK